MSLSTLWIAAVVLVDLAATAYGQVTGASFIYPINLQQNVNTAKPFQWNSPPGGLMYRLYVGTTLGANDLADSYEIPRTSFAVPPLPVQRTLYARIWTNMGTAGWVHQDVSFTASPAPATFVYPANGQQNVSTAKPFQWNSPPGSLMYRLYIGTTPGANDLADSYEIPRTSFTVPPLPVQHTLYARIWTNTGSNGWVYQDVSFTASPAPATFVYPANGQQNVSTAKPFQWRSFAGDLKYRLYVGTSPGGNDLSDSYEITGTSFTMPSLPVGRTLYARIWTNTGSNGWVYQDINFTAAPAPATFSYPINGQQNVSTMKPFQWSLSPGALAYRLYVGTNPGSNDLADSYETQDTSFSVSALPVGETLYARIWTNTGGGWVSNDISFTAAPGPASFIYPVNGTQNVNTSTPFQWSAPQGALAYRLYVGTTLGGNDLADSYETSSNSFVVPGLPKGSLYARIWTNTGSGWVFNDIAFTAAASPVTFEYPAVRSVGITSAVPFRWTTAAATDGVGATYRLTIGTTAAANDLFNSGPIQQTAYQVPSSALPPGMTLYARVTTQFGNGQVLPADTVFETAGGALPVTQMIYPTDGNINVDVSVPFQWTASDVAQAYQLKIFSGGSEVYDSGEIQVSRYFAENLPTGTYTAQINTKIAGNWYSSKFGFSVTLSRPVASAEIASALWAVDSVRHMADVNNFMFPWTDLWNRTAGVRVQALCSDYRDSLLAMLSQMNVESLLPLEKKPRRLDLEFDAYDTHTLVEFWNTDAGSWMLLDPTFDIAATRSSDGGWATKEDIHNATISSDWTAISYRSLGSYGLTIAHAYYLDYPLLYLNIPPLPGLGAENDPIPYLVSVPAPSGQPGVYVVQCSPSPTVLMIDGSPRTVTCDAKSSLSAMFWATTISLPPGSTATVQVFRAGRNVF